MPIKKVIELHPNNPAIGGNEPLICVSLVAKDRQEALAQIRRLAARQPDLIEIRLDYFETLKPNQVPTLLQELSQAADLPLLATCRHADEGGHSRYEETIRLEILQAALESRAIRLLDFELRTDLSQRNQLLAKAREYGVATIVSYHDFNVGMSPIPLLRAKLKELANSGADIVKLAVYPSEPLQALDLLALTYEATTTFLEQPLIAIAMGKLGSFTRLASPLFGGAMTFAVGENSSAPGQLDIDVIKRIWQNWQVRSL